ncbi:MAG: EAL domain-containing protein [Mycobacteriales bacterium]
MTSTVDAGSAAPPVPAEPAAPPVPAVPVGSGQRALREVLSGAQPLRVHLQPVVELSTGAIWGVEALARFPGHPQPGPAEWFDAALRDGRGPELEALALQGALEVLPLLPAGLRLTVNLSAQALLTRGVQRQLHAAADPRLLIELTEHESVADYPALLDVLGTLRERGIGLGIDDFGAGHSSWRHVLHLAPDVLKLDLSLVQGVELSRQRQSLVAAMVAYCLGTDTVLVAEGVEEAGDLAELLRLGVAHAQGWFLARPAEPAVVLPVLGRGDLHPAVLVLH